MGSVDGSVVLKKRTEAEDKVNYPHLIWRKTGKKTGVWYYRQDLSPALREIFGQREIKKSLRTPDKAVARQRYHKMALEVEESIRDALNGSPARSEYGKLKKDRNRSFNKAKRDPGAYYDEVQWSEWVKDQHGRYISHDIMDPETTTLEEAFLINENRKLRAEIKKIQQNKSLANGDLQEHDIQIEARESLIKGRVPASEPNNSKLPKLSSIIEKYLADTKDGIGEKTYHKRLFDLTEFRTVCENKPIDRYGVNDGREYYEFLRRCVGRGKKTPLAPKTIKIKLHNVTSLFRWAKTRYGKEIDNPVEDYKAPRAKKKFSDISRRTYSSDELNTLFRILKPDAQLYWPVLLALYTGVRLQAVVQLAVGDIREEDGVSVIHFHDMGDNQQKNASSVFTLPVHQTLISLGFLGFVKEQKDRLFPEFTWNKHSGNNRWGKKGSDLWGDRLGKRYAAFLRKIGLKESKLTFHSIRHTYTAACRDADIYDGMRHWLQGRAEGGSAGGYARDRKTAKLSVMRKYIDKIEYGIELEK
ncbi:MAG: hypothetical protein L3J67_07445 [Hyphomicrobiaceae bacterium]|nr:hypothetical protein [Hyphomicrobiaceae bacterium]